MALLSFTTEYLDSTDCFLVERERISTSYLNGVGKEEAPADLGQAGPHRAALLSLGPFLV